MNILIKLRCYILCTLFALCGIPTSAQLKNATEKYDIDSALYSYYQHCKAELKSPNFKQHIDTLFQMAGQKGDTRMQAVALTTLLDHYYFDQRKEDSILHYVNIVKEFAKSTNQPKYYYFAWGKRLITYYIKAAKINTALFEVNKMLKEAEQDKYPDGIATCYNTISKIYQIKGLKKLALENKEKEIEIILKYKIDTSNLSTHYSMIGKLYCSFNQLDKAEESLKKAQQCIYSIQQELQFHIEYIYFYRKKGEYSKAEEHLIKAKTLLEQEKTLSQYAYDYYYAEGLFYIETKQYDKALSAQNIIEERYNLKVHTANYKLLSAQLYEGMGNFSKALQYYKEYVSRKDSISAINEGIAASEISGMLGVERLNRENSKLQQEAQKRDLTNKTRIIIFLVVLLLLCFIIFYRERHLNGKLRVSEKHLSTKNKELLESEAQLLIAKKQAEDASSMKTEFIQSMSHEIRTPLNSIVGFSQIISSINAESEDTKEYAGIIEKGSNNLLLLIDDVIDLASLDSGTEIPTNETTEIASVCKECIMMATPYAQPNVKYLLEHDREEFYLQTNTRRLTQMLFQLLRNAGKFTSEGHILLKWKLDNERQLIVFTITDTGIGIPADKCEYIFERFAKIDSFTQGTGLGLPISRLCAEKMGGSLSLDTDYTSGSRFILTLPLKV